jgi:dimethylhistidine N-methyltransferase
MTRLATPLSLPLIPPTGENAFLRDVLADLLRPDKQLPCKYFYDEAGSRLFDQICELPEYYPTRCELSILRENAPLLGRLFGPGCLLLEYGSGSSLKTRLLLEALQPPAGYVPVDISRDHLLASARALAERYPELEIAPLCADFTWPFEPPALRRPYVRRVVYFSGSTIGNFNPAEAARLLAQMGSQAGAGGQLLIGVDLKKERSILEPAYNDAQGVTARFNLNLLVRINRELGADFDLGRFRHHARYNSRLGRIEMYLISRTKQEVNVGGERIHLAPGEAICTEHSWKYGLEEFADLAGRAGQHVEQSWTDAEGRFAVILLRVATDQDASPKRG